MFLWRALWRAEALLLSVMIGCSSTPPVMRMDAGARGEKVLHVPRTVSKEPVKAALEECAEAIRRSAREVRLKGSPREEVERLFQLDPLYGDYLYLIKERKLLPMDQGTPLEGMLTEGEQRLASRYNRWCRSAQGIEGDCLGGALVGGKYLDLHGRYMWALAMSKSPVLEEFEKALGEMAGMEAVIQAAMWTVATLLLLLALPEPVTKFVAASATTALILWIGAKALYNLITGWFQLMEEVKVATTFEEIRDAGEKFGRLFSREAAQAFAMIAMAALTHSSQGFASQVGKMPGSAQVSMRAASQEGILLSEVGAVESVAVTADGFIVALPPGAVAMAASGGRTERHHIGTIRNKVSTARGGPWTPRFQALFARAGMRLQDPENIVPTKAHRGPHPQQYHQIVYDRLDRVLGHCSSIAVCRERLIRELADLAKEISTPGSELNQLVTRAKPR